MRNPIPLREIEALTHPLPVSSHLHTYTEFIETKTGATGLWSLVIDRSIEMIFPLGFTIVCVCVCLCVCLCVSFTLSGSFWLWQRHETKHCLISNKCFALTRKGSLTCFQELLSLLFRFMFVVMIVLSNRNMYVVEASLSLGIGPKPTHSVTKR